ncbi:C-type lectin domain family 2 member B isoform X2 [Desmodus rotundus]|nr:C-type lectin domain family 2 member B isoform X2 [Desmodus rotundus]
MTESITLDAQPVPENAISSQETDAKKQGDCKNMALIIVSVSLVLSVIGVIVLAVALSIARQSRQYFCPDKWIGLQDNCYYFSNHERNWSSSRKHCCAEHADLTVIDTTDVMDFLRQHKCNSDHWIGLEMKGNQIGKWVTGKIFNQS